MESYLVKHRENFAFFNFTGESEQCENSINALTQSPCNTVTIGFMKSKCLATNKLVSSVRHSLSQCFMMHMFCF